MLSQPHLINAGIAQSSLISMFPEAINEKYLAFSNFIATHGRSFVSKEQHDYRFEIFS